MSSVTTLSRAQTPSFVSLVTLPKPRTTARQKMLQVSPMLATSLGMVDSPDGE